MSTTLTPQQRTKRRLHRLYAWVRRSPDSTLLSFRPLAERADYVTSERGADLTSRLNRIDDRRLHGAAAKRARRLTLADFRATRCR